MGNKNTKLEQSLLGIFLALILSFAFVGVAYVDGYMNGQSVEVLWESDSDAQFANYEYVALPSAAYRSVMNHQFATNIAGGTQYNRTFVYEGNSSWASSFNDTGTDFNSANLYFELPNLDDWIIDKIVLNMTENNDPSYLFRMQMWSTPLPAWDSDNQGAVEIFAQYAAGGDTWNNRTIDLPLSDSLEIYNNAVEGEKHVLFLNFYDDGADWDAWAWKVKIEIHGEKVTGWSKADTVNLIVGGAIFANVVAIIYVQDQYDVGGYVKDIRKRSTTRRQTKRKR